MSLFDSAKDKLSQALEDNADKVEQASDTGLDKAAELAKDKTGGQFSEQVEQARDAADQHIGE
ncbi:MAG: antitoxin [Dermatophilaceae bacterium]